MHQHNMYHSTSGLATRAWGPSGWFFLFSCIMGGFPPHIDPTNKEHKLIQKHFKNMFVSLGYTMPCVYCRNSYKQFAKELPIEPFLKGRIELMSWLYQVRDKVNKKLIQQERECYNNEKKKLKKMYYNKEISKEEYYIQTAQVKKETFITQPSPSFDEVLKKYESIRATCSKKAKTCSLPK